MNVDLLIWEMMEKEITNKKPSNQIWGVRKLRDQFLFRVYFKNNFSF